RHYIRPAASGLTTTGDGWRLAVRLGRGRKGRGGFARGRARRRLCIWRRHFVRRRLRADRRRLRRWRDGLWTDDAGSARSRWRGDKIDAIHRRRRRRRPAAKQEEK